MRYATQPRERKYVQGYGFVSFAKNLQSKVGSKAIGDSIIKHGKDAAAEDLKQLEIWLVKRLLTRSQSQSQSQA